MKELSEGEVNRIISEGSQKLGNMLVDKIFDFLETVKMDQFYGLTDKYTKEIHSQIILTALAKLPELIERKLSKK